jgi:transcription elongation factor GreA
MIKTAKIIDDDTAENEAGINKKVTLYIPEDDVEEVYTIVSTMRQNSLKGLISVESPLGKALQHHKTGDTITVRVNANYSYEAVIRKVEDSEEAESASLRNY